ncbi:MAG: Ig-like domain-containing protein [Bacteroidaceae bacterium]|nr:Ig-like domain-containing protein [Bacteroidaceae bacterium]MBQ2186004.1 Ig-like domain-containing protein [Bacteroidaceae bacterium]MBR6048399.1 Ig-like domain-containing protein [Bacteroidaceae bacterium]
MNGRRYLTVTLFALLLAACASIGNPDGGRYDETPPKVLVSYPADKATNSDKKKISIAFDEYIKLENASEKVIVSPPQIEAPNIRADGKRVRIDLYDSLQANTTYTIDFSDAIEDNNEGNPMGNYTYSFSTGDEIDTMEVAGTVLNAENLEPIKGIMVGLYPADTSFNDTILRSTPFKRVSRTNGSGKFSIKGVKPGKYHVFALKDADGNFLFNQKSEIIAFDTTTYTTSQGPDLRMDTVWRDSTHWDSIRAIPFTHYYPDDIVLRAFQEEGQDQHMLKNERLVPESFTLYFTAPADSLPKIKGLNFNDSCLVAEPTLHNDTITYWVTDTMFTYHQDTLAMTITYLETDTLGMLSPHTDTLEMAPKTTYEKLKKEKDKKIEDWEKEREKKLKKAKEPLPYEENPFLKTFLEITGKPAGSLDPNQNVVFTSNEPIASLDTTMMHFYLKKDSNLIPQPFLFLPVEGSLRSYTLYAEWETKQQYVFQVDSAAFLSILGNGSKAIKQEFRVRDEDEFGSIFVHITSKDSNVVVQIMSKGDKPMRTLRADEKGRADFYYMKPGDYYIRCFIDNNQNDKWDTGNYQEGKQPEEVFYFPKPLTVKAKWDLAQDWNPRLERLDKQKAMEITKQKPDKEKTVKDRNRKRDEEMRKAKSGRSKNSNNRSSNSTNSNRNSFR